MNALEACLSDDEIRLLATDRTPPDRLTAVEAHVASCTRCAAAHDQLLQPIIDALRNFRKSEDSPEAALVAELAVRLKALPRDAVVSTLDATRSGTQDPAADSAPSVRLDMLEPPQGPGELGRLGKFRVLEVLGRGGMGCVFRAEDTELHRHVALKVILLRPGRDVTAEQRKRFMAEAEAAAKLDHRNITPVLELYKAANGTLYIAMPLLRGTSLDARLRTGPSLSTSEVCRLGAQIAEGLAAAHEARIVHRDVKPSNVWLEPDGTARVLDFGLAKPAEDDPEVSTTGSVVGSPSYMAPEQANAEPVDSRADLYSLGVMLYEMLTGKRLFKGGRVTDVLSAVRRYQVPPAAELLPGVPRPLAELVAGLLAHEPTRRNPATAITLAERLRHLERTVSQAETPTAPHVSRWRRRRTWIAAGAGFLVVAAVGVGQVVIRVKKDDSDPGTVFTVPAGSTNVVRDDGALTVTLPAKPKQDPPVPAAPVWSPKVELPKDRTTPTLDHLDRSWIHQPMLAAIGYAGKDAIPEMVACFGGSLKGDGSDGHKGLIKPIALHPSGYEVASGGDDGAIRIWDLSRPGATGGKELRRHAKNVTALRYMPDGQRLISGDSTGLIVVWDVRAGTPVKEYITGEYVMCLATGWRTNVFASGHVQPPNDGGYGGIRVFPLDGSGESKAIRDSHRNVMSLAFSSDDERLFMGQSGFLKLYEVRTGTVLARYPETKVWHTAMAVSPDGTLLATNGPGVDPYTPDRLIKHFVGGFGDTSTPDQRQMLSVKKINERLTTARILPHAQQPLVLKGGGDEGKEHLLGRVHRSGFSADGTRIITLTADGNLHLWDWQSESKLATINMKFPKELRQDVHDMAAHPDGRHAIVSLHPGVVAVLRFPINP